MQTISPTIGSKTFLAELDFISIYPTEGSWDLRDRSVACVIVKPAVDSDELVKVTGSLKG